MSAQRRDAVGNPLTLTEASGDVVTWSYDTLYELTRESRDGTNNYDITYTYDPAGNRLTKVDAGDTTTYTYDAANELLIEEAPDGTLTTYTYDEAGNVAVTNAGGDLTTYTWDGENRMVVVALPNGTLATQTYDATGLRRRSQAGAATTNFLWDARNVLLEADGDDALQALYTSALGAYGPLVSQRRDTASSFFHFDALGSTTELTSAAAAVTDTYRYYAFGETRASTGSTTNPFGFVGRLGYYTEPTLALQYLRARWYQPSTGRFVSRDAIRSAHRYVYMSGDPAARVDPSGLQQSGGWASPDGHSWDWLGIGDLFHDIWISLPYMGWAFKQVYWYDPIGNLQDPHYDPRQCFGNCMAKANPFGLKALCGGAVLGGLLSTPFIALPKPPDLQIGDNLDTSLISRLAILYGWDFARTIARGYTALRLSPWAWSAALGAQYAAWASLFTMGGWEIGSAISCAMQCPSKQSPFFGPLDWLNVVVPL